MDRRQYELSVFLVGDVGGTNRWRHIHCCDHYRIAALGTVVVRHREAEGVDPVVAGYEAKWLSGRLGGSCAGGVGDNLAVGAGLGLSTSTYKPDGSDSKFKSSSITLSPFARCYFDKIYVQGAFQFGSQKSEFSSGNTTETSKDGISGWSLAGGYAIMLNESVALEPQVGYQSIGYKDKDRDAAFRRKGSTAHQGATEKRNLRKILSALFYYSCCVPRNTAATKQM